MWNFVRRAVRRNYGQDKEYYRIIDELFGFVPHNIELYKLALIHKSASLVLADGRQINNERLEFLGDAVIEAVTSDYLYIEFPDRQEGFLTQLRSKIVSRQSLNTIARTIGLDRYVIANPTGSTNQKHIYGDAFEAMIGAIYLDRGYEFANRLLINNIYYRYLNLDNPTDEETDFKKSVNRMVSEDASYHCFRNGARPELFVESSDIRRYGRDRRYPCGTWAGRVEEGGRTMCGPLRVVCYE